MPEVSTRDRDMILNPSRWQHIWLPLVRNHPEYDCALVTAPIRTPDVIGENEEITVILTNLWAPKKGAPRKTYQNVDALLADGWRVD